MQKLFMAPCSLTILSQLHLVALAEHPLLVLTTAVSVLEFDDWIKESGTAQLFSLIRANIVVDSSQYVAICKCEDVGRLACLLDATRVNLITCSICVALTILLAHI